MQAKDSEKSEILKSEINRPANWLKKPTSDDINTFVVKSEVYAEEAKLVRESLIKSWIKELSDEKICVVTRLNMLRNAREEKNVWPCPKCDQLCMYNISI